MTPARAVAIGVALTLGFCWVVMAGAVWKEARADREMPAWAVPLMAVFVPPVALVVIVLMGLQELARRGLALLLGRSLT